VKKDTSALVEELGVCPDFKTFYNENKTYLVNETLSELLSRLLTEKALKKADIIRKAEMSETYAYQIFAGIRVPTRGKLLCLAVAMGLSLEETQTLLKCAGFPALYVKLAFDSIVLYGICKRYSVVAINNLLYEYGQETLG